MNASKSEPYRPIDPTVSLIRVDSTILAPKDMMASDKGKKKENLVG